MTFTILQIAVRLVRVIYSDGVLGWGTPSLWKKKEIERYPGMANGAIFGQHLFLKMEVSPSRSYNPLVIVMSQSKTIVGLLADL